MRLPEIHTANKQNRCYSFLTLHCCRIAAVRLLLFFFKTLEII